MYRMVYTLCMIQQYCPACDTELKSSDMNLAEGVALCGSCGALTRLSDLVGANNNDGGRALGDSQSEEANWRDMPRGCKVSGYQSDATLTASARSVGGALGMLFFTLFWNGITLIFVIIMLAGFYKQLGGTIPDWAKDSPLEAGNTMSLGMCFFLLLFLTPFVLIGAATIVITLVTMLGDVKVRLRNDQASVSTGIGPLRWTNRFKASEVRDVHMGRTKWQQNNQHKPLIVIEASTDVRFGSVLSDRRMRWLCSASKLLLLYAGSEEAADLLATAGRPSGF